MAEVSGHPPKRVLIVYHSQSGHTEQLAEAAARGASCEEGVRVKVLRAGRATVEDLLDCDGLLLGTPENFGYMSGMMKDFFDRTYDAARGRVGNLPYAVFVSAGNDGSGAVREIERIARGYPFKRVAEPVIAVGPVTEASLEASRELGQTLAAGLVFGVF